MATVLLLGAPAHRLHAAASPTAIPAAHLAAVIGLDSAIGPLLLALGVGLIAAELFMPAFGSLGVGGLAALIFGSIILFNPNAAGLQVPLPLIVGIAVAGALLIAVIVALAARARRRPVSTGIESMLGEWVEVISRSSDGYVVRYGGELWNARSAAALHAGQSARIARVAGLTLWIDPQQNSQPE